MDLDLNSDVVLSETNNGTEFSKVNSCSRNSEAFRGLGDVNIMGVDRDGVMANLGSVDSDVGMHAMSMGDDNGGGKGGDGRALEEGNVVYGCRKGGAWEEAVSGGNIGLAITNGEGEGVDAGADDGLGVRNVDGEGLFSGSDDGLGVRNVDDEGWVLSVDDGLGVRNVDSEGLVSGADDGLGVRNVDSEGLVSGVDGGLGVRNVDGEWLVSRVDDGLSVRNLESEVQASGAHDAHGVRNVDGERMVLGEDNGVGIEKVSVSMGFCGCNIDQLDGGVACAGHGAERKGTDSQVAEVSPVEVGREENASECPIETGQSKIDCGLYEVCVVDGGSVEIEKNEISVSVGSQLLGVNDPVGQSLGGVHNIEVKYAGRDDPLPIGTLENQNMEIDKQDPAILSAVTCFSDFNQVVPGHTGNDSSMFCLVGDMNRCMHANVSVSGDINVKLTTLQPEYRVSDLVWGKVRSHPWWPGQIFAPSAASEKAKKYSKWDCNLVAFFGDKSFAWNDATQIKPFQENFSQLEKQSSSERFCRAVDSALEEISRRVEFGLACSCIPEGLYAELKSQKINNAGIREKLRIGDTGDSVSGLPSFEPSHLVKYIRTLAQGPLNEVDKLEYVAARAQLVAFFRLCRSQFPKSEGFDRLIENDVDTSIDDGLNSDDIMKDVVGDVKSKEHYLSERGNLSNQNGLSRNAKQICQDDMGSRKKEKRMSDLMADVSSSTHDDKAAEQMSSKSCKRCEIVNIGSDDQAGTFKASHWSSPRSHTRKKSIGVGDKYGVASTADNSNPQKPLGERKGKRRRVVLALKAKNSKKSSNGNFILTENVSSKEILSQLYLAARHPFEGYEFLMPAVPFVMEFRNSDFRECAVHSEKHDAKNLSGGSEMATETSELEGCPDSYWTDRIIQCDPDVQYEIMDPNESSGIVPESFVPDATAIGWQAYTGPSIYVNSTEQGAGDIFKMEYDGTVDNQNGSSSQDDVEPTALILKFTDLSSVPTVTYLNDIFRIYGPLNELQTEVLARSSSAKIVFKRRADAERAFSSAGKYSTFGPSLVSYRLDYHPSKKYSARATKRKRKDVPSA